MITVLLWAIVGSCAASVLACVPGLHAYNLIALILVCGCGQVLPPQALVPVTLGIIVGYSMLNTVPSVLLAAPDESAIFTVLPGQKYLMRGRGYEGTMIVAAGGLAGLILLVTVFAPLAPRVLPVVELVLRRHIHWILWCVICFMFMSEWPRSGRLEQAGWRRFLAAWRSLGAGLLTFLLSGLLGFILFYRPPVDVSVSFQNLMPAFVGLFTAPWLLLNIVSRVTIPAQELSDGSNLTARTLLRGTFAGGLGGGFAAFVPIVTGGVGALLAGHATSVRDDRTFLVSQGASKTVYYVGSLLLLFVPGVSLTRGGAAGMLRGVYSPSSYYDYYMALAAVAVAGAVSFLLVAPLARCAIGLSRRWNYRWISLGALVLAGALVLGFTRWTGALVALTGAGIGLIPPLFGTRRMNCLGVILLPAACDMAGIGPAVARWLGLL